MVCQRARVDNVFRVCLIWAWGLLGFEVSDGFFDLTRCEENFLTQTGVQEGQEFLIDILLKTGVECTVVDRDT